LADDATLLKRRARRRLVGAIALVVFVVIVLPIVLDQEQKPVTQTLSVQIPSQDGGPFNTRVLPPLPSPPATAPAPKSEVAPAAASAEEKKAESKPVEKGAAPKLKSAAKETAKAPAKTNLAEARRAEALLNDEAYVVPLGVFANPDNAKQVRDKAASAGIVSYAEKVKLPQGEQTRVRAGPFQSKSAAEKARDKLKALGLDVGQVAQR
jgi:DedD protein